MTISSDDKFSNGEFVEGGGRMTRLFLTLHFGNVNVIYLNGTV